jgi:hypothetical protein
MGWEQVEKQVVEAVTHMEAMGTCVREYGSVSGEEGKSLDGRGQTIVFQVVVCFLKLV